MAVLLDINVPRRQNTADYKHLRDACWAYSGSELAQVRAAHFFRLYNKITYTVPKVRIWPALRVQAKFHNGTHGSNLICLNRPGLEHMLRLVYEFLDLEDGTAKPFDIHF